MIRTASCILLSALLLACSERADEGALSDRAAREVLEKEWNSATWTLLLGAFTVVGHGDYDLDEREISPAIFKYHQAFAEAGVIRIVSQTGGFLRQQVITEPTEAGLALKAPSSSDHVLDVKEGSYEIAEILQNEVIDLTPDRYHVVLGTFTADESDAVRAALGILGLPTGKQRKFRVLLGYDAFKKKWRIVEQDTAEINADFSRDRVGEFLASKRS